MVSSGDQIPIPSRPEFGLDVDMGYDDAYSDYAPNGPEVQTVPLNIS
jgi:hypothetical protein